MYLQILIPTIVFIWCKIIYLATEYFIVPICLDFHSSSWNLRIVWVKHIWFHHVDYRIIVSCWSQLLHGQLFAFCAILAHLTKCTSRCHPLSSLCFTVCIYGGWEFVKNFTKQTVYEKACLILNYNSWSKILMIII